MNFCVSQSNILHIKFSSKIYSKNLAKPNTKERRERERERDKGGGKERKISRREQASDNQKNLKTSV